MSSRPASTDHHLAILDELAEIGMVLARRLPDLPPLTGQDTARDFDLIARAVRRSILLFHAIINGTLPAASKSALAPERETAPAERSHDDSRTRLDAPERLDDVSAPFELTVAAIIRDIKTVLASSHGTEKPAPFPAGAAPDRPEADAADLN